MYFDSFFLNYLYDICIVFPKWQWFEEVVYLCFLLLSYNSNCYCKINSAGKWPTLCLSCLSKGMVETRKNKLQISKFPLVRASYRTSGISVPLVTWQINPCNFSIVLFWWIEDGSIFHLFVVFLPFTEMEGGKFFFNTVKEGDNVTLASDDENERALWVQAIYRATGQTHKPVPPVVQTNKISNTQISRMQGGKW